MQERIEKVDMVIIGAGIAGLSLAFESVQKGLRTVVLDDGRRGTTYAATGLLAPRPDYMLKDIDLVKISDKECLRWVELFPDLVGPTRFLIPIDPNHRWRFNRIEALLKRYDQITPLRRAAHIPPSTKVSQLELETLEPNLKRNYFDGALVIWELTVDPGKLLQHLDRSNKKSDLYKRLVVDDKSLRFELAGSAIYEIAATTLSGREMSIKSSEGPMIVVNAGGPWMKDIASCLGVTLDVDLRLGIQMAVSGYFFQSGIITFNEAGTYCICLPCEDYVQIGPTNTSFNDHPDKIECHDEGMTELFKEFQSLLEPDRKPVAKWRLKSGLRVKPPYGDTNRPIIWSHARHGLGNFYTLLPGKMSLGLLAARELLKVAGGGLSEVALDGNATLKNKLFLKAQRAKSLAQVSPYLFL